MKNILFVSILLLLITFGFSPKLTASTYYWVGNGGDWQDYSTHWATSSGGSTFHTQVPTPSDDVVFDANSFTSANQLITLNTTTLTFYCHNMTWTGVTNNPRFGDVNNIDNFILNSTLRVYGSFTLSTTMTWEFNGAVSFESSSTGNTISSFNQTRLIEVYFNSSSGGWQLGTSFHCQNLHLERGSLNTMGDTLTCGYNFNANSSNPFTLLLGTSYVRAENEVNTNSTALTLDADSATISCGSIESQNGQHYKKIIIASSISQLSIIGSSLTVDELIVNDWPGTFYIACHTSVFTHFTCHAPAMLFYNNTYVNAVFYKNITTDDDNTIDTLTLSNPQYTCNFKAGKTLTIANSMIATASSCSGFITIRSTQSGSQASISKSSGSVTCAYLTLQDIAATGGATFTANNSTAISNVTGWAVNAPTSRTLYWVGGTGNWSDQAHWSTTSGGTGGNCPPSEIDNVNFNASSFANSTDTLYMDESQPRCNSMKWSGSIPGGVTIWNYNRSSDNLGVYGKLQLKGTSNWIYAGTISFNSSYTGNTIQTHGISLANCIFNGNGSWSLSDALNCNAIDLRAGTLYTLNHNVHCLSFNSDNYNTRSFLAGTSDIYCRDWHVDGGNFTMDGDSATFHLQDFQSYGTATYASVILALSTTYPNGNTVCRFEGTNATIGSVTGKNVVGSYSYYFNVNNALFKRETFLSGGVITFGTVEFKRDVIASTSIIADTFLLSTGGFSAILGAGTTVQANHFITSSSCGAYTTIRSDNPAAPAHISVPSGTVSCSNIILDGIAAGGGATFNAFNSLTVSNVSGWNILSSPTPQTLYWVNGTGNWNGHAHWSNTSGGASGACQPTFLDDVIFDANSFPASNDTVIINASSAYCHNMTWQTGSHPVVYNNAIDSTSRQLTIFGSLTLDTGMTWSYPGQVVFAGSGTSKTIRTNMVVLKDILFDSYTSGWTLQDSINCDLLEEDHGFLKTAGNNILCSFRCQFQDSVELDSSVIRTQYFNNFSTDQQFNAGESQIFCSYFEGHNEHYNIVRMGNASFPEFYGQNCTIDDYACSENMRFYNAYNNSFGKAVFSGSAEISGHEYFSNAEFDGTVTLLGNNTFDTLFLNNGGDNTFFDADSTQRVNLSLLVNSGPSSIISFGSTASGTQAHLACYQDTVCIDYVIMRDIDASGPAIFNSGANSIDDGDNSNMSFTPCIPAGGPRNLYWVNGTGTWDDASHWSATSGGTGGEDEPTFADNIFFDNNSFLTPNDTVNLNGLTRFCRNMTWETNGNPMVYDYSAGPSLRVYGDFILDSGMVWQYPGYLEFHGTGTKMIHTEMVHLGDMYFESTSASWMLDDSLSCEDIYGDNGSFNTANYNVNCFYTFQLSDAADLGTSLIHCSSFNNYASGSAFDGDSATVSCGFFNGNDQHYRSLTLERTAYPEFYGVNCVIDELSCSGHTQFYNSSGNIFGHAVFNGFGGVSGYSNSFSTALFYDDADVVGDASFGAAEFDGETSLAGNNTFDTLKFYNAGHTATLEAYSTQTVNQSFLVNSNSSSSISFISNNSGNQAEIACYQDTVCIDYVVLQDINSTGTALFYAGSNSTDNGNNSNIAFTSCDSAFSGSSSRDMDITVFNAEQNQDSPQLVMAVGEMDPVLYPNPGNDNTTLDYAIASDGNVVIEVYDVTGKWIFRKEYPSLQTGHYSERIITKDWSPGVYDCRITTGTGAKSIRFVKTE